MAWRYDVTPDESASVNIAMLLCLLLLLLQPLHPAGCFGNIAFILELGRLSNQREGTSMAARTRIQMVLNDARRRYNRGYM